MPEALEQAGESSASDLAYKVRDDLSKLMEQFEQSDVPSDDDKSKLREIVSMFGALVSSLDGTEMSHKDKKPTMKPQGTMSDNEGTVDEGYGGF